MKSLLLVFLGILLFSLGFIIGGVHWNIPEKEVGFWAMIGGWVSGIATLAAVAVSLYMANESLKSSEEQLHVSLDDIHTSPINPEETLIELMVKSVHNVRARVTDIGVQLGKNKEYFSLYPLRAGGQPPPYAFEGKGDALLFSFNINTSYRNWYIFEKLKAGPLKQGFFIVETTMKRYELKMTSKELLAFEITKFHFDENRKEMHTGA